MKLIEKAKKHLRSYKRYSSFGAFCQFYKLDKYHGIKEYKDKDERDLAVYWQRLAHKHKLGPKVYGVFTVTIDEEKLYCYITQIAQKPGYISNKAEKELQQTLMRKLKWHFWDGHSDNMGRINGKLVPIDFC